jgi:1-acyl-sn-glycerol-3-phosphate acyltransferase
MGSFKKGSLRPVAKAGVPVVPISIDGTYRVMEANNNQIKPARVTVTIAPPIYPARLSVQQLGDINSVVREAIAGNLPLSG